MLAVLMLFMEGVQDPDFWWHLRVGHWMVDNGWLPSLGCRSEGASWESIAFKWRFWKYSHTRP